MLHHDRTPYRWQDHVITPRHTLANLVASALVLAVMGGAALAEHHPPPAIAAQATQSAPTQTAKRPLHFLPHVMGGC
jgi:hypothetical protein